MSSKSILIILSYTVSKFARFFETVYTARSSSIVYSFAQKSLKRANCRRRKVCDGFSGSCRYYTVFVRILLIYWRNSCRLPATS